MSPGWNANCRYLFGEGSKCGSITERCLVELRGGNDGQHYADSGGIGDLRCDRAGDPDLPDEKEGAALIHFQK